MSSDDIRDLEILKADIASRLRPACAHFCEADFDDLVHQIAQIEVKYARRGAESEPELER